MAEEKQKMTYEELEQVTGQLAQQNEMFRKQLEQNQLNEIVARLNFLFKVVESAKYFDKEYLNKCISEIKRTLVVDEPEPEKDAAPESEDTDNSVTK